MAITKCPECGSDISTAAHACPQCGHPNRPLNNENLLVAHKARNKPIFFALSALGLVLSLFTPRLFLFVPIMGTLGCAVISLFRKEKWQLGSGLVLVVGIGLLVLNSSAIHKNSSNRGIASSADNSSKCKTTDINLGKTNARTEGDYIYIDGTITNNCDSPTGVQLKMIIKDKDNNILKVHDMWPASTNNIPAHSDFPFESMERLVEGFDNYEVRIITVTSWSK